MLIDDPHHPATPTVSKPEMKLLVLAQKPPPVHGQSVMVETLLRGLPARGITLHHVNLPLSHDTADIGRWRIGKMLTTLACAARALTARFKQHCDTLYYVPAPPAKRGALYRDWTLLLLCRPFFRRTVFHWHAAGLGAWLDAHATSIERVISRWLLGRAELAITLAEDLRRDLDVLRPRRVVVVPNGIPDPGPTAPAPSPSPFRFLFLGLCGETKGVFSAITAVLEANRRAGSPAHEPAFVLTLAGPFADRATENRLLELQAQFPQCVQYAGIVSGEAKNALFANAHALLFPTHYSAEALPLVALEALAHDRPIVATRWRGLPDIVTPDVGILVPPNDPESLVVALLGVRSHPPAPGACRARYETHFTLDHHLALLATALRTLD